MSKAYKIKIPINIADIKINEKKVNLDISLLEILDKSRMQEIFKDYLIKEGAVEEDNALIISKENKAKYKINLEEMKLEILVNDLIPQDFSIETKEESLSNELRNLIRNDEIEIDSKEQLNKIGNIDSKIKAQKEIIDNEINKVLLTETVIARQLINKVLKDVYKDAIKEKADSMGNVTSISESDENGEYRIRLEIV